MSKLKILCTSPWANRKYFEAYKAVKLRLSDLQKRSSQVAKLGDRCIDRLSHLCFLTLTGFCVGCTFISQIGYPAVVSGKSMQPAFNPHSNPPSWMFHTESPPEDPFSQLNWSDDTFWEASLGDVIMALWTQDWVWVNTWKARKFHFLQGDVVVYTSPKDPYDYIIKRVIAVEGDIVSSDRYELPYVRIPDGHLWLEGDNWGNSVDSNKYGAVSKGLVFGVATHIIWPPSRWRKLDMKVLHSRLQPERIISSARIREVRGGEDVHDMI